MKCPASLLLASLALFACHAADEPADPVDECATCDGGKADVLNGSCDASVVVKIANTATFEELDIDAALNVRAVEGLVAARPFATLADVDAVPFVGVRSIEALLEYGVARGVQCDRPCDVDPVVAVANLASFKELDVDAALDRRAAEGIVAGRPFADVAEVDAVPFVGPAALERMRAFGARSSFGCGGGLGIISDLDKTVIPPDADENDGPPYPGVATLYDLLLGSDGSITYVTAREPDRVVGVPAWLETNDVPVGTIETGISGIPFIAEDEKVRDITRTFEATPGRTYVMFGDTSHVDAGAFARMVEAAPDRVAVALIHRVTDDEPELPLRGYDHYVEAAAILAAAGVISETDVRTVFAAAVSEGLDLSEAELEQLLVDNGL